MKKPLLSLLLSFAATFSLPAAYVNIQSDGDWSDASIWESPPEAGNGVNVRYALSINEKLSDTYKDFVIGDSNKRDTFIGTLTIGPKGDVKLSGVFNIARNIPKAGNGTMVINGGRVECGAINLGSGNNSPSTAMLILENGATLLSERTINVGHASGQKGTLRMVGSKNTLNTGTLTVRPQGCIVFVADADGFSTIETSGRVYYDSKQLIIDGALYKGPAKTFTLIDAGNEGNTNYKGIDGSASISGFKDYQTRLFLDGNALKLELSK